MQFSSVLLKIDSVESLKFLVVLPSVCVANITYNANPTEELRADKKPGPMGKDLCGEGFFCLELFTAFMRSLR